MQHIARVVQQLRAGGYYDRVMSMGPELDRVKAFLEACAGLRTIAPADPIQHPHYPLFPGLRHEPWHDPARYPAAKILEDNFAAIRDEAGRLGDEPYVDYTAATVMPRTWKRPWTLLAARPARQSWALYLFYHLGVLVEPVTGRCPRTLALLQSLPGACLDYTWGDFVFSAMKPGLHLATHCSVDNLRVRLHLGIRVPKGCTLRVGPRTRTWEEGRCLAFEDSFEHEVHNRSAERRVVLIADLWHPDLSPVEVRALTALFRKSEVRRVFMHERIGLTDSSQRFLPYIESRLAAEDRDPVIREFWPA